MQKDEILTVMTVSPIITETYAFYDLFYGDFGIVRRNMTGSEEMNPTMPADEGEATPAEEQPAEEPAPAEGSEEPAAAEDPGFLQAEGTGTEETHNNATDTTIDVNVPQTDETSVPAEGSEEQPSG